MSGHRDEKDETLENQERETASPVDPAAAVEPVDALEDVDIVAPVDLSEESGGGLAPAGSPEHTSDALYIVRESNVLTELVMALETKSIELKEEAE